jgi:ribosome maturation factor RimP
MSIQTSKIAEMVESFLQGTEKFLVEVLVKPGNRVYVFIDGDHGVTIDDCVRVSRMLENALDRETEDFELNVSSAGADQPLRNPRQYPKNIGRSLHIKLADEQELKGKLVSTDGNGITLITEGDKKKKIAPSEIYIQYQSIAEAKVIISFK